MVLSVYSLRSCVKGYFIVLWRRLVMNVSFFKIQSFGLFYGRIIGNGVCVLNWVKSSVLNISGVFTFFGCVFIFCVGFCGEGLHDFWVKFSSYINIIVPGRKKKVKCWKYSISLYRKHNLVGFVYSYIFI